MIVTTIVMMMMMTMMVVSAITCPTPQVDYGSSVCPGGLQFKSVCTLSCEAGFVRGGLSSVQCLDNATWSGQGTCLGQRELHHPLLANQLHFVH